MIAGYYALETQARLEKSKGMPKGGVKVYHSDGSHVWCCKQSRPTRQTEFHEGATDHRSSWPAIKPTPTPQPPPPQGVSAWVWNEITLDLASAPADQ